MEQLDLVIRRPFEQSIHLLPVEVVRVPMKVTLDQITLCGSPNRVLVVTGD